MKLKNLLKLLYTNFLTKVYNAVKDSLSSEVGSGPEKYLSTTLTKLNTTIAQQASRQTLNRLQLRSVSAKLSKESKAFLQSASLEKAKSISDTLKSELKTHIEKISSQDLSIEEQQKLVRDFLKGKVSNGKADVIADTEYGTSYNFGENEALLKASAKGKIVKRTWKTSGANIRDSHAALEGEVRLLNEEFSNGLMYPMDPSGPPEEIINCKCYLEISVEDEE